MVRAVRTRVHARTRNGACMCMHARAHANTREHGNVRTHALYAVYIVRNNEEFAQTGIPTFFKQGEQGQTALYGRMDKHTQPRITHRASRPGDMRIACLCTSLSL